MGPFLTALGNAAQGTWQFIGGGIEIIAAGAGSAGTTIVSASSKLGAGANRLRLEPFGSARSACHGPQRPLHAGLCPFRAARDHD